MAPSRTVFLKGRSRADRLCHVADPAVDRPALWQDDTSKLMPAGARSFWRGYDWAAPGRLVQFEAWALGMDRADLVKVSPDCGLVWPAAAALAWPLPAGGGVRRDRRPGGCSPLGSSGIRAPNAWRPPARHK